MLNKKVRFAVLGCGRISISHLDAIKNAPDTELAAVCDIIEEKARHAAQQFGLEHWYTDLKDMLCKEEIDVICICTPSGMHCEHTEIAAKAGKHVLCEKPLDVTHEKVDRMIDVCNMANVLLGGIFQRRTNLAAINARNAIQTGKLGRIVMANARLNYYRSQEYYDSDSWRGTWKLDGGGALMNQGIHGIDMLQWLVGDIDSVFARCATLARNIEVEDTAVVAVKFKSGALGTIAGATSVYPGQDTVFTIHGEKGTISLGDQGFYIWDIMNSDEKPPEAGDGFGGTNCGWTANNSGHIKLVQDMAEAVRTGTKPLIPGTEARKAVDLVLAIYESSRTDREVKVNSLS
jgi:Predicted dehydrogenases and related proteins